MNGTVTLLAGGGDGAVEGKHAAKQNPMTDAVKSRSMIRFLSATETKR